jgi:hypothetical protein
MRKIVPDPGGMVHVPVRQQYMVDRYDLIGGLAYVKADIQLRHPNDRLFARYRIPDDIQIVDCNLS